MPNYDAKAIKINWLNHEVIGLNVETTQKISYEAGQFMMINFHKNGKETPKAYSITNAPSKNRKKKKKKKYYAQRAFWKNDLFKLSPAFFYSDRRRHISVHINNKRPA